MVRKLQPDVIIDNRLEVSGEGYGSLAAGNPTPYHGDFVSPEQMIPPNGIQDVNGNDIAWESCVTMNNHWGYCANDHFFKPAPMLIKKLVECVSKGGNLLLNVGPDARGNIPEESIERLAEIGKWMKKNGESIYGCGKAGIEKPDFGRVTRHGNHLYFHVYENTVGPLPLPGVKKEEIQAIREGYIYIHDMSARRDTMNCCLFDVKAVLEGGFEMGNIWYNEPKSLDVAFDVIGDIVLSAASQQYGGFTVPSADLILDKYAEISFAKYVEKYTGLGLSQEKAEATAMADVERDFEQGFQGWEYKFNTVASSRGDYPFITMTMGTGTGRFAKLASITMLNVRRKGQGKKGQKKPVLFPKIVFLYDENLHGPGKLLEDVFEAGILCSSRAMYPDWLSLTGEGYVPSMYKKYGAIISPMGCRAFLSPWYERGGMKPADESDKPVFVGRWNIGAVSLHLPMIYAKAQQESRPFCEVLDYYLELIRKLHIRTYAYLGEMRASTNPLAYCEGGFYGGHLKPSDKIKPIMKTATASFGITALNELQELYNGKSLAEDGQFALETLQYINDKVEQFKNEDGNLYAIYGTPAESLCGLQVEQFRKKYGIIEGVSDRPYVSNSFHCHVTEDLTPIQKQDLEGRFWNLCNGGKIQYVKYPIDYNHEAIRSLVRRAMAKGFYEGVNLSLAYCDDCGHEELSMDVCPKCGSRNLTKIERMNGYLSYSRVKGDTRLNDAKMAEIAERKSM